MDRIAKLLRDEPEYRPRRMCLHPSAPNGCDKVVSAHSVQRAKSLEAIAEEGHVLGFPKAMAPLVKKGLVAPEPFGIRVASTFPGFCKSHDDETFAAVEKVPFQHTREQVGLIHFRGMCYEWYAKLVNLGRAKLTADQAGEQDEATDVAMSWLAGAAVDAKFIKDHKEVFGAMVLNSNWSRLRFACAEIEPNIPLVASGVNSPFYSVDCKQLQDGAQPEWRLRNNCFSIIHEGNRAFIVISWLDEDSDVIDQLWSAIERVPPNQIVDCLVRYAFVNVENVFMRPSWWAGLTEQQQRAVMRMVNQMFAFTTEPWSCAPHAKSLVKTRFVQWVARP
ncbi:MAG TPA: hypothetical protein VHN77_04230 [Phycisphaerales bacterium]|nr:hypothetical protein [Phycisphaerales bacterium]